MVKILCYGHGYTSSNLVRVIIIKKIFYNLKIALIAQR